jgi:hypothetical protein
VELSLDKPEFSGEFNTLKFHYEADGGVKVKKLAKRLARVLFSEGEREFGGRFRQLDDFKISFGLDFGTVTVTDDDRYDADYLKAHEEEG